MTKLNPPSEFSRRSFLRENAMGVGMVALATLLQEENLLGCLLYTSDAADE